MSHGSDINESSNKIRVLVCDDDYDIRMIISHTISAIGYEVVEASNGQEAMDICNENLPDAVIMDIMMPGMSGTEVVSWLRKEHPEPYVPVLMVTAKTDTESTVENLRAGADDYLTKPFNAKELQARLAALVRTRALMQELRRVNDELKKAQAALVAKEREEVGTQLAGAAAHKLRQPVTAILLHCHLADQGASTFPESDKRKQVMTAINTIRKECESVNMVLDRLEKADPNQTTEYVGSMKIIDIEE